MPKRGFAAISLIAINAIFYVITFIVPGLTEQMFEWFALYLPGNPNFRAWQFVSYLFMHGSFIHIFFNMFALYMFGVLLEEIWGRRRFLFFYFVAGIGAGAIFLLVNYIEYSTYRKELVTAGFSDSGLEQLLETGAYGMGLLRNVPKETLEGFYTLYHASAVGASGAIYGILVAFAILLPNAKLMFIFLPVPVAAKYFVPALIAIDLFSGITGFSLFSPGGAGIAHFAHIGGAVIGLLLMLLFRRFPPARGRNIRIPDAYS